MWDGGRKEEKEEGRGKIEGGRKKGAIFHGAILHSHCSPGCLHPHCISVTTHVITKVEKTKFVISGIPRLSKIPFTATLLLQKTYNSTCFC